MSYVPLNRILTDQFTNGGEYYVVSTGLPYSGYYHEYYNGDLFTGNNQFFSFKEELAPINTDMVVKPDQSYVVSLDTPLGTPTTLYDTIPSYYPQPTDQDYTVGNFTRYFAKQINGLKFIEISLNTYNDLKANNPKYLWSYYNTFNLPWSITGQELQVGQTNKNNVMLAEKLYSAQGLGLFLQEDYLKFYKK